MNATGVENQECQVCVENMYYEVECPFCRYIACRECVQKFLLSYNDDRPKCMNCNKIWSFNFLALNLSSQFYKKKYREYRAGIQYDREKAQMPGTQSAVALAIAKEKDEKLISDLLEENLMFRRIVDENNEKIRMLRNKKQKITTADETRFVRACPGSECRGFLSTSYKCGICNKYACKYCNKQKNNNNEEHKCDPDLVETLKVIDSETKPCPGCKVRIQKINGCDQMFCVKCHVPFSWKSGKIERGVIHNPHYYEWIRHNNDGYIPRAVGDVICGGPPSIHQLRNSVGKLGDHESEFYNLHRLIQHITYVERPKYPVDNIDNIDLRIQYLRNRISEKTFRSKLKQRTKKQEKNIEITQILSMFTDTMSQLLRNIISTKNKDFDRQIFEMHELRTYTNISLGKVGEQFDNVVPFIDDKWVYWPSDRMRKQCNNKL